MATRRAPSLSALTSLSGRGPSGVPDFSDLSGLDLENAARQYGDARAYDDQQQRYQTALAMGDPRADYNRANDAIMESSGRAPDWAAFFGALRAKRDAAQADNQSFTVQYGGGF